MVVVGGVVVVVGGAVVVVVVLVEVGDDVVVRSVVAGGDDVVDSRDVVLVSLGAAAPLDSASSAVPLPLHAATSSRNPSSQYLTRRT